MPATYHLAQPPDRPAQWVVFGGWVFDITAAAIIRGQPRETASLPVAPWAPACGVDRDPGSGTVLPRTCRGHQTCRPVSPAATGDVDQPGIDEFEAVKEAQELHVRASRSWASGGTACDRHAHREQQRCTTGREEAATSRVNERRRRQLS
jgi:hypothetical protein